MRITFDDAKNFESDNNTISDSQAIQLVSRLSELAENQELETHQLCLHIAIRIAIVTELPYVKLTPYVQEASRNAWFNRVEQSFRIPSQRNLTETKKKV